MRICLPACVVNVCVSDVALNDMVTYTSIDPSIPRLWGSNAKKPKRRVETCSEYAASRYVCGLKDLVDQAVQGELSAEAYPSVLPMPARYVRRILRWLVGVLCGWLISMNSIEFVRREDKPVARSLRKPDKGRLGKQPATYTGGE